MNDIKVIHTQKGEFAVVDADLFPILNAFEWKRNQKGYFHTHGKRNKQFVFIHRVVNGTPIEKITDHRNGFLQDCTRRNLRNADFKNNASNRGKSDGEYESRFKGVSLMKGVKLSKPWRARITVGRAAITIGLFHSQELAARAYNAAALKHHGEFAKLNIL